MRQGGTDLTLSDAGAGGAVTINHDDNFSGSAAQYTSATVTVNATGHITAIASGTAGPSQATQAALEARTNEDTYAPPDLMHHHPGVAKFWALVDQANQGSPLASYNIASISDGGVGITDLTIGTDFSSVNWSGVAASNYGACFITSFAAGTIRCGSRTEGASPAYVDTTVGITGHGDQ